jgi:hypothetical protein
MSGPQVHCSGQLTSEWIIHKIPACPPPFRMDPPRPEIPCQPRFGGISSNVLHDAPQVLFVPHKLVMALVSP